MRRLLPLLLGLALAAGCGTPSADLFIVERSGSVPDAKLKLLVGDGGTVECDGASRPITSAQLLEARELARDLAPLLRRKAAFPARRQAVLRFRVIGEEGDARFADVDAVHVPVLARVVQFTRGVATTSCGRAR